MSCFISFLEDCIFFGFLTNICCCVVMNMVIFCICAYTIILYQERENPSYNCIKSGCNLKIKDVIVVASIFIITCISLVLDILVFYRSKHKRSSYFKPWIVFTIFRTMIVSSILFINVFVGLIPIGISIWTSYSVYQGRKYWMDFTLQNENSIEEDLESSGS